MKLVAFHNDPKIKKFYLNRVLAHQKADNLVRGLGWKDGKGCAVGCTLEKYDHKAYESELGIPAWLAGVEDVLFEGMSEKKSRTWPSKFLSAVKPGIDLEKVKVPFLILVLKKTLVYINGPNTGGKSNLKNIGILEIIRAAMKNMIVAQKRGGEKEVLTVAASLSWIRPEDCPAGAWNAVRVVTMATADSVGAQAMYAAEAAEMSVYAYCAHAAVEGAYDHFADELIKLLKRAK